MGRYLAISRCAVLLACGAVCCSTGCRLSGDWGLELQGVPGCAAEGCSDGSAGLGSHSSGGGGTPTAPIYRSGSYDPQPTFHPVPTKPVFPSAAPLTKPETEKHPANSPPEKSPPAEPNPSDAPPTAEGETAPADEPPLEAVPGDSAAPVPSAEPRADAGGKRADTRWTARPPRRSSSDWLFQSEPLAVDDRSPPISRRPTAANRFVR